jgi:hypothetical protein
MGGANQPEVLARSALIFVALWFVGAGINMWLGVVRAGYSVKEEIPFFFIVFLIPSAAALLVWWFLRAFDWDGSSCGDHILQDIQSPDGRRHAVVFERDCGATTDFTTQVSVLTLGRSVNGGGNVFVTDSDHGKAAAGPGGGPNVTVRWLDKRTLEIRYDARARIFSQDSRHDDTEIRYIADTTAPLAR